MFYYWIIVGLFACHSSGSRHRSSQTQHDKNLASTGLHHDKILGTSFTPENQTLRPKYHVPTYLLIGGGAVILLLLLGLTFWLLRTKRVVRERGVPIRVPNSNAISLIPSSGFSTPSWGVSTIDMVVPAKVSLLGTWDFSEDGLEGISKGFFLFYPGGGTYLEYESGWSSRNFRYKLDGFNATGTIYDCGEWSVTFTENGKKGKGRIGESQMHMVKRCEDYKQADQFYQGTWDLWMQKQSTWVGFLTLNANSGYLEFENGMSAADWSCEVSGMNVKGMIPGQGPLSLEFAPDGSVGVAKIGAMKYYVWRRHESE